MGDSQLGLVKGQILGGYTIGSPLWISPTGTVYLAQHTTTNMEVALKLLSHAERDSETVRAWIRREIETLIGLNHPNLVRILAIGQDPPFEYIVMERFSGATLQALMEKKELDLRRILRVHRAVLEGLQALHSAGVVHRNLTPDVVIAALGPRGRIAIADFGLLKPMESDEGNIVQTGSFARGNGVSNVMGGLGKPPYCPPEQKLGTKPDQRSDLYAAAMMLYVCLAGQTPWPEARSTSELQLAQFSQKPTHLGLLMPEYTGPVADYVMMMIDPDPMRRPASASESMTFFRAAVEAQATAAG